MLCLLCHPSVFCLALVTYHLIYSRSPHFVQSCLSLDPHSSCSRSACCSSVSLKHLPPAPLSWRTSTLSGIPVLPFSWFTLSSFQNISSTHLLCQSEWEAEILSPSMSEIYFASPWSELSKEPSSRLNSFFSAFTGHCFPIFCTQC